MARDRDDLVATRAQLANQLRSLLESFWLRAAEVPADVDSPIALTFIDRHLTPETIGRLGRAWTNRKTYDPTQHRAAQTFLQTVGG